MSKISLTDLANLQNETTAITAINSNNAILETALDNTLSRDGTSPNMMGATLDMNSHRIINLPTPGSLNDPVRLTDVNILNGGGTITVPGTASQLPFVPGGTVSSTDVQAAILEVAAESAGGSNYTAPYSGAVTRTQTNKFADVISVKDFGAIGNGSIDDTNAIQAAINVAAGASQQYALYFPSGSYKVLGSGTGALTFSHPIKIFGDGASSRVIAGAGFPNTRDMFQFNISSPAFGFFFQDMFISMGGLGRHAIHFNFSGTGNSFLNAYIRGCRIDASNAGYSIKTTNSDSSSGLAYSTIEDNNLNCLSLDGLLDGVIITKNIIGTNISGQASIRCSFIVGAGGFRVEGNVIAGTGAAIILDNGAIPTIRDNYIETIGNANTYGFLVDIGSVSSTLTPQLVNNNFSVLDTSHPIPIRIRGNCTGARIADSRNSTTTGGSHIQIDSSATDVSIDRNTQFVVNNAVTNPVVIDNGTRTGWVQHLANGAAATPALSFLTDTDTGIYRVGANSLGIATGGVNLLTVSNAGGVAAAPGFALSSSTLFLNGATSGTTIINPAAVASGTLTLPTATDTLVARNTVDIVTNKIIDGATNNVASNQGGYTTGRYYTAAQSALGGVTFATSANVVYFFPFEASTTKTWDRIAFAVNTAGTAANVRVAIYTSSNGQPGGKIVEVGSTAVSGTGLKAYTISQSLSPGSYWLAILFDGTETLEALANTVGAIVRHTGTTTVFSAADSQLTATLTFGAFPTTAFSGGMGAATYTAANSPIIALRST